jgi:hypothetical protein
VWESYRRYPYSDFFVTSQREKYFVLSWFHHNPSPIHRNVRVTRVNDLVSVVTLHATVMASGSLTYLVSCSFASHDCNQVRYLEHHMVLAEAAGDAESVL